MRRLFAAVTLCTAFLLLAGVASAAVQRHASVRPGPATSMSKADTAFAKVRFAPLSARLASGATVYGTLYDSYHNALSGKSVEWDSWSLGDSTWHWDSMNTLADGSYSMTALATGDGEIWAYPDSDTTFARLAQSWSDGGSYKIDLYPGRVNVSATRGGPWSTAQFGFTSLAVRLYGGTAYSHQDVAAPDNTSSPVTGAMTALDGTYDGASVNFFYDEGSEFAGPITVASGATSGTTVSVDEAQAQRVWIRAPYWASGKPGATVKLACNDFPAGWKNAVTGYSDPKNTAGRYYGTKTSQGGAIESLSVKVPATAKPGYGYWIGFQHVDASGGSLPLYVEDMYQVSTMKPSKSAISKGTKIRVTGIVPTEGHWDKQAGLRKSIVLWWHRGTAGVPTNWNNPKKQGWLRVGAMKTTTTGAYTTPYFKPPVTGTFVVQYAGDNWYLGAFTSTAKVRVR
jgi:hypothetical protein